MKSKSVSHIHSFIISFVSFVSLSLSRSLGLASSHLKRVKRSHALDVRLASRLARIFRHSSSSVHRHTLTIIIRASLDMRAATARAGPTSSSATTRCVASALARASTRSVAAEDGRRPPRGASVASSRRRRGASARARAAAVARSGSAFVVDPSARDAREREVRETETRARTRLERGWRF